MSKRDCRVAIKTMAVVVVGTLIVALVGHLTASPACVVFGLFFAATAGVNALVFILAHGLAKE